jgi:pimeloyl-ACP methyl ester carboxylesterase
VVIASNPTDSTNEQILARFPPVQHVTLPRGVRLAYREWGAADAPPVVLVHGITSSSLSWARVAAALAGRYRAIATDNKGHGDSARPAAGYRFDDQARETAGLMRALGIERARVIGHSWGGAIAVALATGSDRDLVERLVLEDPLVAVSRERSAEVGAGYSAQVGLTRAEAEALLPTIVRPGWTGEDAAGKLDAMVKGSPDAVRAVFAENTGSDLVPRYADLRCPTLLVLAAPDVGGIVAEATLVEIRRGAPAVQVATVAGADHNVHRTRFDEFMAVVEPFLAGT